MNNQPENGFRKENYCPYCKYKIDAATIIEGDKKIAPKAGDLSFCLMCTNPLQFTKELKLKQFNLNTVKNINERNRLKLIQIHMENFWETASAINHQRRHQYLKNLDEYWKGQK